jgi:hypothetical protein
LGFLLDGFCSGRHRDHGRHDGLLAALLWPEVFSHRFIDRGGTEHGTCGPQWRRTRYDGGQPGGERSESDPKRFHEKTSGDSGRSIAPCAPES